MGSTSLLQTTARIALVSVLRALGGVWLLHKRGEAALRQERNSFCWIEQLLPGLRCAMLALLLIASQLY